jgi:hypothetical protein
VDGAAARVLGALSDAGIFRLGGVLVGTYAYVILGNVLGRRWNRAARTQHIDIAARIQRPVSVAVAVPEPARLALHTLAIAEERPAAFQGKAAKDREQATALLDWLHEERPGDIDRAWRMAGGRFPQTASRIAQAAKRLRTNAPWRLRLLAPS